MKNRYCLFCGTLLPEDGVCLRCGAKYELANDGQMKVITRKVKKVSAKASVKKKITAKKASDPSEVETQTIPIPEDIFSFSDDAKKAEKYADWTGDAKQKHPKTESDYVPNFVMQEDPSVGSNSAQNDQTFSIDDDYDYSKEKTPETQYKVTLLGVFFFFLALAACLSFLLLNNRTNDEVSAYSKSETTVLVSDDANSTTIEQPYEIKPFSIKTINYHERINEIDRDTVNYGFDTATFSFDKKIGRLNINAVEEVNKAALLLCLLDDGNISGNHATLASFYDELAEYDALLCESNYIKKGIIKEIIINTTDSVRGGDYMRSFQFEIEKGRVNRVYEEFKTIYHDPNGQNTENSFYDVIIYNYDTDGLLTSIEKQTDDRDNQYGESRPRYTKEYRYDNQGLLKEVFVKVADYDVSYIYTAKLNYENGLLSNVTVETKNRSNYATYTYNSQGLVNSIRHESRTSNYYTEDTFEYTAEGRIQARRYYESDFPSQTWYVYNR